jgi:hypothetical protein
VNYLCHASWGGAQQKKATHGAGGKRRVTAFAMRHPKNARQRFALCRAPHQQTHDKHTVSASCIGPFVVRLTNKRTAKALFPPTVFGHFVVRLP